MKINFGWTVCTLYAVYSYLNQRAFERFRRFQGGARRCVIIARIRNCFQCLGREKLSAQNLPPKCGQLTSYHSTTLNSIISFHTQQLNGWLVTSNPQLLWFEDMWFWFQDISEHVPFRFWRRSVVCCGSVVGPVITLLQGSFIDVTTAADILLICKLAVMKLRRSGDEVWQSL